MGSRRGEGIGAGGDWKSGVGSRWQRFKGPGVMQFVVGVAESNWWGYLVVVMCHQCEC